MTSMNVNGIATKQDKQRSLRGLMLGIAGCVPSADIALLQEVKLSERDHITTDACQALADNVFPGMTSYWTPFVGAGLRSGIEATSVTTTHGGRVMTLRIGDTEVVNAPSAKQDGGVEKKLFFNALAAELTQPADDETPRILAGDWNVPDAAY